MPADGGLLQQRCPEPLVVGWQMVNSGSRSQGQQGYDSGMKRPLYHVTPTRNVASILERGLEPRGSKGWQDGSGEFGGGSGHIYPPRVWLCRSLDGAYWTGQTFLMDVPKYQCTFRPPIVRHDNEYFWTDGRYWRSSEPQWLSPQGAPTGWRLVRNDTLSIVVIRPSFKLYPDNTRSLRLRLLQNAVWTDRIIEPSNIICVRTFDQAYLISPRFRRHARGDIRGKRDRRNRQKI